MSVIKQRPDLREGQNRRVLEACLALVLKHGPRGFKVQQIVESAEISQSKFFRLFDGGMDQLLATFWSWCWSELNDYLARRIYSEESIAESQESAENKLLREFDYIWELDTNDRLADIAFLCFFYYRRGNELRRGGELDSEQLRFEQRVMRLCDAIVKERESSVSPTTLQIMVLNWCATVLMAWHYAPEASKEVTAAHARLGLRDIIRTTLKMDQAA